MRCELVAVQALSSDSCGVCAPVCCVSRTRKPRCSRFSSKRRRRWGSASTISNAALELCRPGALTLASCFSRQENAAARVPPPRVHHDPSVRARRGSESGVLRRQSRQCLPRVRGLQGARSCLRRVTKNHDVDSLTVVLVVVQVIARDSALPLLDVIHAVQSLAKTFLKSQQ